jgi:tRNA (cytidine/uridine-2'-O-)-methyltransferase
MSKNNIVLYQPEIPQNTGNVMRTCAGTDTTLHLIKPLGFSLDEKHIKMSETELEIFIESAVQNLYGKEK